MVDEDVLLADGGEAVAAEIADALGKARIVGLELEVRALVQNQLAKIGVKVKVLPLDKSALTASQNPPRGQLPTFEVGLYRLKKGILNVNLLWNYVEGMGIDVLDDFAMETVWLNK